MSARSFAWLVVAMAILSNLRPSAESAELETVTWKVGPDTREALVHAPEGAGRPVIFAWHGHGGTAKFAARKFDLHTLWPEAIVVYPQGLPTPSPLVDPQGKRNGWQKFVDDQGNRDLAFFDAMRATCLDDYHADRAAVFSVGHSNGGFFTYLLAATRGDTLKAIAPIAANVTPRFPRDWQPIPVLHVAGEHDPLVKFAQQRQTIDRMRERNGCAREGKPAGKNCVEYPSDQGTSVIAFIHAGGHEVPAGAMGRIVEFFQGYVKTARPDDPARRRPEPRER